MIEMAAINLMARGAATTMMERLRKSPRRLRAARNDLRATRTTVLSLSCFAQFEVRKSARGPEKRMKDIKTTTRRAKERTASSSLTLELY
jgi:hypothetical protein